MIQLQTGGKFHSTLPKKPKNNCACEKKTPSFTRQRKSSLSHAQGMLEKGFLSRTKACSQKQIVDGVARDVVADQVVEMQEYFVYFKSSQRRAEATDPTPRDEMF
ncbi:MAG: hypothetical protein IJ461_00270 [Clostridia bacterium]|nr:hypothetical protein [Clostridia bacterium]